MTVEQAPEDRLRPPPAERFAGDSHLFNLQEALAALRAEPHEAQNGHRQITILHRPPVAHVLFSFDEGGRLDRHSTPGLVTIHALEGHLLVSVEGDEHSLTAGNLLILDSNVPHDVHAQTESAMLLTIHRD